MLKAKQVLVADDLTPAWDIICDALGAVGKDFYTVSMRPKKGAKKWFHASSEQRRVLIEKAKDPTKNSQLTMHYWIRQPEFELIAEHYNGYVTGLPTDIRRTDSHVSSYIITLIANLL